MQYEDFPQIGLVLIPPSSADYDRGLTTPDVVSFFLRNTGRPYIMNEGEFWDEAKAESNLEKHNVSFEAARLVFDDVFADERCDFESAPDEIRYVITGRVNDVVLRVVYTERGERIRIISARKATANEEEEYSRSPNVRVTEPLLRCYLTAP